MQSHINITTVIRVLFINARISMITIITINISINLHIISSNIRIIRIIRIIIALSTLHLPFHITLRNTDLLRFHLPVFPILQELIAIIPLLIHEIERALFCLLFLDLLDHPRDLLRRMVLLRSP